MDSDISALGNLVMVFDGSAVSFYLPKTKQYGSIPASALNANDAGDLGDLKPEAMDDFMVSRYRSAADLVPGASFLREEGIDFGGAKVDCYVISVSLRGAAHTWWVDSKRYLILREYDAGSSSVFTTIKLGEPLPDELFKFEIPAGALKLDIHP